MSFSGELYNFLGNYLPGRLKMFILNGKTSSRRPGLAGARKGSI